MRNISYEQIRKIAVISWVLSFAYFVYLFNTQDIRSASNLSFIDKVFCWIFIFQTLALAEVIILGIRGVERSPRLIWFTIVLLLGCVITKVFQ